MSNPAPDLISSIIARQQQTADLRLLSGELFKLFGGVGGFAKAYHECYSAAPSGSSQQAQLLRSILELMKATAPEGGADALADLTPAELAAGAAHLIGKVQQGG